MVGSLSGSVSLCVLGLLSPSFLFFLPKLTSCVDGVRLPLALAHGLFDLDLSMRYETLTLGRNVIRFPVPSCGLSPRSIF